MQTVRLIPLGEIVTPDISKTVVAFMNYFKDAGNPVEAKDISTFLYQNMALINQFKTGELNEQAFDTAFLQKINATFKVNMQVHELNPLWLQMCPVYNQYQEQLTAAIKFISNPEHKIYLYSFSNPKDVRFLIGELVKHKVPHELDEQGHLKNIAGMPLYLTYVRHCNNAEAAKAAATDAANNEPGCDLAVISSANKIDNPVLAKDLDHNRERTQKMLEENNIQAIAWNKGQQTLDQLLTNPPEQYQVVAFAKL